MSTLSKAGYPRPHALVHDTADRIQKELEREDSTPERRMELLNMLLQLSLRKPLKRKPRGPRKKKPKVSTPEPASGINWEKKIKGGE